MSYFFRYFLLYKKAGTRELFLVISCLIIGKINAQEISPNELLLASVKHRLAITSACIELTSKTERFPEETRPGDDMTCTIWLDGIRLRNDVVFARFGSNQPLRTSKCRNCPEKTKYFTYDEAPKTDKPSSVFAGVFGKGGKEDVQKMRDPRVLGMVPSPFATVYLSDLDNVLAINDRKKLRIENGDWKKNKCHIVRFERDVNQIRESVWIVPSMGNSVARIEVAASIGDSESTMTLENELALDEASGIWFPKMCTFETTRNGKLATREVIRVLNATFNVPISDEVFSLLGMSIPPGNLVKGPAMGSFGKFVWNGKEITKEPRGAGDIPAAHTEVDRTYLVISAIILATVGLLLGLWWVIRSTRSVSNNAPHS